MLKYSDADFSFSFSQFAPGFQVGDGIGMDLKLSNHVFNALKQHAYSEERRSARLHEKKEHSTAVSIRTFNGKIDIGKLHIWRKKQDKSSCLIFYHEIDFSNQRCE